MPSIPSTCTAVQLTGPEQLKLNPEKPIQEPTGHQILCRVLVVGLCFSDMKLLKQFSGHVRKSAVQTGADPDLLVGLPSYVPGDHPTVPGHETVVEIFAVGDDVSEYEVGDRYVVQADWRWLKTQESNGAFGYNFEGGLQEYVLVDERLIKSPEGEPMFLPIKSPKISRSSLALVEPWACVEESYQSHERQNILPGGKLLLVREKDSPAEQAGLQAVGFEAAGEVLEIELDADATAIGDLADNYFDDIIYFGADAEHLEALFPKSAKQCIIAIALCGNEFGRAVMMPLGDIHYRGIRIAGTSGSDAADAYRTIPEITEIRPSDRIHIVGAGGPMGVMHVMRNLCQGIAGIEILAADLSDERLDALAKLARPAAAANNLKYESYSPAKSKPEGPFDYSVIMAPIPALCAEAVKLSKAGAIINIFAGIPAGKGGDVDLNHYINNKLYFFGTSGSVMEDMKIVKRKVESGQLDTNVSVAAISGLDGAIDGLRAVDTQQIAGKIMVYPECKGLGLTELPELQKKIPAVYAALNAGVWGKESEDELLAAFDAKID